MTREEARKAAEIMLAYADGKEIESLFYGEYKPCEDPSFNWSGKGLENYRVKSEPTYRPFKNAKECWEEMLKHQPFGWVNSLTSKYWLIEHIPSFATGFEVVIDGEYLKPEDAFKELTFVDGTPFGIKEE